MTKLLKKSSKRAFTMAEILLSLTIIGVVAAITLPSLTGNINERTWNTQRKALYARISQGMALMPALNGLGNYSVSGSGSDASITDTATQTFVTELGNVLKINNVCDNEHFEDCGIVSKFNQMAGSEVDVPKKLYDLNGWFSSPTVNTNAVAFETQNGESIVALYNRNCKTEFLNTEGGNATEAAYAGDSMCVNFLYDLNGQKGPNTIGKDIGFITVVNSTDPTVVSPMPLATFADSGNTVAWDAASNKCTTQDPDSRLPNFDELVGIALNRNLFGLVASTSTGDIVLWSSTVASDTSKAWALDVSEPVRYAAPKGDAKRVLCVKR